TDSGTTFALYTGTLVAARDLEVDLALSAQGKARVWVGKKLAFDVTRDEANAPLPDEDLATISLARGATKITVLLQQSLKNPTGSSLRAGARSPAVLPLLFTAGPADRGSACSDAELAQVEFDQKPVAGGFTITTRVTPRGLVPRHGAAIPLALELATPDE